MLICLTVCLDIRYCFSSGWWFCLTCVHVTHNLFLFWMFMNPKVKNISLEIPDKISGPVISFKVIYLMIWEDSSAIDTHTHTYTHTHTHTQFIFNPRDIFKKKKKTGDYVHLWYQSWDGEMNRSLRTTDPVSPTYLANSRPDIGVPVSVTLVSMDTVE